MTTEHVSEERHIFIRMLSAAAERYRPPLGWMVLTIGLVLALLPAIAIREAGWIDLGRVRVDLEWVVFFSLLCGWVLVSRLRDWVTRVRNRPMGLQTETSDPAIPPVRSRLLRIRILDSLRPGIPAMGRHRRRNPFASACSLDSRTNRSLASNQHQ